jgi:ADP-ribose pyrophosphatase
MTDMPRIKKLTDEKWLNLYEVEYQRPNMDKPHHWLMCSRKDNPVIDAAVPDAVFIVPVLKTPDGNRLVMTREFRAALWDVEYGFPAGLIDAGESVETTVRRELKEETGLDLVSIHHISPPVYSSAGMSDESCCMVLAEVSGTPCSDLNEAHEEIEVVLLDAAAVGRLLGGGHKIAGKAWGLLYHFAVTGKIELVALP